MFVQILLALGISAVVLAGNPVLAEEPPAARDRALELVNADRAAHDLPPLRLDDALTAAAKAHAEDMTARDYFSHIAPDGTSVMGRYLEAGGSRAVTVAENIGACGPCPAGDVTAHLHQGWMNSDGHRANILDPGLDRFGYGTSGNAERLLAVQTFAGPGTAPPGAPAEAAATPLSPEEQHALAVEIINARRHDADATPLTAAPALGEALGAQVPENHLVDFTLEAVTVPMDAGPRDGGPWRKMFVLGGRCGGCGVEVTARDVHFFVGQWMDVPAYRDALLDTTQTHLGLVISADGTGAKVALAAVAGE
jgi:hypothetical protein